MADAVDLRAIIAQFRLKEEHCLMVAIPVVPSTLENISKHAIDKYIERADQSLADKRYAARLSLFRMFHCAHLATERELVCYGVRIEWDCTYYFSSTSVGLFCMVVRDRTLKTILRLTE